MEISKPHEFYHEPKPAYLKRIGAFYRYLANYHDHTIEGMEHVPEHGPCIIAANHSFATYDIGILQYKIYKAIGKFPRGIADDAFFKIPSIGRVAAYSGALPGKHSVGEYVLKEQKAHLLIAPGGMREALRPKEEKYQVKWDTRKGFVRLAVKTQSPILLAACPAADDLYTVKENKLTKLIYKKYRLPLAIATSKRKGPLPDKVKLTHYLSRAYPSPEVDLEDEQAFNEAVDEWHHFLSETMAGLMQQGR